jgi:hypothetical protein
MPYDIRKKGTQFQLILERTGKVLGTHPSKEAAREQIGAIESSKARKEGK